MNATRKVELPARYEFVCGADVSEVKYLGRRDDSGCEKEVFTVIMSGFKVYFEMMRLKPKTDYQARNPRNWGFGDIRDSVSGSTIWNFSTFIKSPTAAELGIKDLRGDMTTIRGADNRTYVDFRTRDGRLIKQFLLAENYPSVESRTYHVGTTTPDCSDSGGGC